MAPHTPQIPKRYGTGHTFGMRRRGRGLITRSIDGVTKASIRKLARRGGVKRIQGSIYTTVKDVIEKKLKEVLRRVILYTEHRNAKTVTSEDICYALRDVPGMVGSLKPVYGYDWPLRQFPDKVIRSRRNILPDENTAKLIAELQDAAKLIPNDDLVATDQTSKSQPQLKVQATNEVGLAVPRPGINVDDFEDEDSNEDDNEVDLQSDEESFFQSQHNIQAWATAVATVASPSFGSAVFDNRTSFAGKEAERNKDNTGSYGHKQSKLNFCVVKGTIGRGGDAVLDRK